MKKLIGVDIGGTKCAVILGSMEKNDDVLIMDKIRIPTEMEKGVDYTLDRIFECIDSIITKNNLKVSDIDAIGVSCGGPVSSRDGLIMSPPNLIGWDNIHITKILEDRYNIKTILQNDANACALAEWKFGAGKGYNDVIFLTMGTGMGAGLILDGKIYNGASDMAGEVGHIRLDDNGPVGFGKAGSFEGFCSGGGIAQLAKTMVLEKLQMGEDVGFCSSLEKINEIDAKLVSDAAKAGDALAIEIFEKCGRYLGKGLSLLIDIINPQIIIIGSIFIRSGELLWPSARAVIEQETLSFSRNACKIVGAGLGESLGDYAALAVAAQ